MRRLLSTIQWDMRLQFRNGFYFAALFIAGMFIVLLWGRPEDSLRAALPVLLMNNLLINAFYFVAGLVLLEKGEGTLEAQIVSPLRPGEYLASKAITLTALSMVESLLIVLATFGTNFNIAVFIAGITLMALPMSYLGFIAVSRYDSLNEFLFPSFLMVLPLSIPMIYYFGAVDHWLFLLHPLQGPLIVLQAAFQPVESGLFGVGVATSLVWIWILYQLGLRAFHTFVIRKEGVVSR